MPNHHCLICRGIKTSTVANYIHDVLATDTTPGGEHPIYTHGSRLGLTECIYSQIEEVAAMVTPGTAGRIPTMHLSNLVLRQECSDS